MKYIGNVVSGICLVICSFILLFQVKEGVKYSFEGPPGDEEALASLGLVAVLFSIFLMLLTTGLRLLGIRVNVGKAKSS